MISYENLEKYLTEKEADFDNISQPLFDTKYFADVVYEIECVGDWKHSHGYLRFLMEQIGYIELAETITEEDGSDWYGSIHKFGDKKFCELFKLKED